MKILHLVQNYYPSIGGSQLMFQRFSEEIIRQFGDEVLIFTSNALYSPHTSKNQFLSTGTETINGVEVHRFHFSRLWSRLYRLLNSVVGRLNLKMPFRDFFDLLNAGPISFQMLKSVLNAQSDVICSAPANYLNTFYPLLAKSLGVGRPLVIYGVLHLNTTTISKLVMWAIRQADAYIALTAYERDFLVEKGVDPKKIHIVGAGVDFKKFTLGDGMIVRKKYNLGDALVVTFIGRHAQYKGIDTLLFAMRMVWKRYPDAFVLIAGSPTEYTLNLKKMIADFSLEEQQHIILADHFDEEEKPNYFAAGDIFVSVSSQESFGIVYLEAWAGAKPVIGGRIGAVQSLIREGVDGLLVNCGSVAELSESILVLLSDKSLRVSMGGQGYERVKQSFTWEVVTKKLHTIYESVIQDYLVARDQ